MSTKKTERKVALLEAALRLFVQSGFHNTPTSRIAQEAGVATGTLFYFFPTKDELIVELYKDVTQRLMEFVRSRVHGDGSPRDIIGVYFLATLQWARKAPTEYRFIAQFTNSPYLQQVAKEEFDKNAAPLAMQLEKAAKEGLIRPIDMELIFVLMHHHIAGVNEYLDRKTLSPAKTDEILAGSFDLFWRMISR